MIAKLPLLTVHEKMKHYWKQIVKSPIVIACKNQKLQDNSKNLTTYNPNEIQMNIMVTKYHLSVQNKYNNFTNPFFLNPLMLVTLNLCLHAVGIEFAINKNICTAKLLL